MTKLFGLSVILAFLASSTTAIDQNETELLEERATAKKSCMITLPGVGRFNQYVKYDFAKWTNFPQGLSISDYGITADPNDDEHPFDQFYGPNNVILKRGRPLQLRVPGGQTKSPIQGAEITTAYDDVLYASVRTVAKVSSVPGTCNGFFFYHSDNQETDIEIRTAFQDQIFLTNQKSSARAVESTFDTKAPQNMSAGFHEYRFDWLKGMTKFYVDGKYVGQLSKNVPKVPGSMVWNNWANGGSWSGGPPKHDNILETQSIEMWYNRTSITGVNSKKKQHTNMPATKAAAAAARMLAGAVIFVPSIAGTAVLEKKGIEEMAAKKGKAPKELAAHEMPSAPKFH
ncbi:concanavalin A-like lectin/glucanase, partial [Aureobasidium melanogenum]